MSEKMAGEGAGAASESGADIVRAIAAGVERSFQTGRRVLPFDQYLDLVATDPERYTRDASRYLRDVFDHFGTTQVVRPYGTFTRYRLFDWPWEAASGGTTPAGSRLPPRGALVAQEAVQEEIYRSLSNFAREGRPNRLVLLHGPNGSAKSTTVACLMAALEQYSAGAEGALYRFAWVFPSTKTMRGSLGFGSKDGALPTTTSYAQLPEDQIDAKLLVEVRDHPLFLIPVAERQRLLGAWFDTARVAAKKAGREVEPPPDWIVRGELSHKSQKVFEALLASTKGSYSEVLRHVQVERYFISRRYRVGAVTIGPQMSVDAGERQITADRSITALPASLQAVTLYEVKGELIDAAGGLLEFSDLLKRPLDTYKYLQLSVETGEVALAQQNVQLNCVMMGSANELHLDAFREHPEYASFRGRLELIRTPYLRSYVEEQTIYDAHVATHVRKHVAPHATEAAAMFAVLTRMRKPNAERFGRSVGSIVTGLTALEKMDLYALGRAPDRLDADAQKLLVANIAEIYAETDADAIYEGRIGASPREMRIVLFDAAQSKDYGYLSPLAVLAQIDELCERKGEFEWLQQEPKPGGYHDVRQFREAIFGRLIGAWEHELYSASGIVDDARHGELFDRYVQHVSIWLKKERIFNRATGQHEEPDEKMMKEVERLIDAKGDETVWRRQLISAVAVWAIDHQGQKVDAAEVFPHYVRKMREAIFRERRPAIATLTRDMVVLGRDGSGVEGNRKRDAEATLAAMETKFGYTRASAIDVASMLVRHRFHDLVV